MIKNLKQTKRNRESNKLNKCEKEHAIVSSRLQISKLLSRPKFGNIFSIEASLEQIAQWTRMDTAQ